MKSKNYQAFTLLEIMMVIAIIALLALIATPHVQHMKMTTDDTLAIKTLRTLSTAAESFAVNNGNVYPVDEAALIGATPPYLARSYCGQALFGNSGDSYEKIIKRQLGFPQTAMDAQGIKILGTHDWTQAN